MTMQDNCPKHCVEDRALLHDLINEIKADRRDRWNKAESVIGTLVKASTIQWALGIVILIGGSAFGLLWRGQNVNAERIIEAHKRITLQMEQVQDDLQDLTKAVIKMEAKHEKEDDNVVERTRRTRNPR